MGVDCNITASESTGPFFLDVKEAWFNRAKLFTKKRTELNVMAIVTGNKQDSDCQHSGFSFEVDIKYLK